MRAGAAALLLAAALGCGAPAAAPPASPPHPATSSSPASAPARDAAVAAAISEQMAPLAAIPWSLARRLTWRDFQGTPPEGGREGALTSYSLFYAWSCRGSAFDFRVVAGFQPRQSWVKAAIRDDSAESRRALPHEQTHFDIAELHARRMRRYFAGLAQACRKSDDELGALAQRFVDAARAMQRRYDEETGHGLRRERQAAWQAQVADSLRDLRRYQP